MVGSPYTSDVLACKTRAPVRFAKPKIFIAPWMLVFVVWTGLR